MKRITTLRWLVLAISLAVPPGRAWSQFLPTAYYRLVAAHSGLALAVSGASTAPGAPVVQGAPSSGDNQRWQLVDAGGGYYKLVAKHSGRVLGVRGASLSDETNRQSFITGPNMERYSKGGFAMISSKAERKVIFLDLKPLFDQVRTMYFTSRSNFDLTQNVGQQPNQWPYTFAVTPGAAPTIAKTVAFAHPHGRAHQPGTDHQSRLRSHRGRCAASVQGWGLRHARGRPSRRHRRGWERSGRQ